MRIILQISDSLHEFYNPVYNPIAPIKWIKKGKNTFMTCPTWSFVKLSQRSLKSRNPLKHKEKEASSEVSFMVSPAGFEPTTF